jgi:hypothetical protein
MYAGSSSPEAPLMGIIDPSIRPKRPLMPVEL